MKTLKSLTAVLLALVVLKSSAYGQQWDGDQNITGSIFRMGKVGIGNNNPGAVLDIADPDGLSNSGLPYSGQLRVFGKICPQIDLIDKDHKDWSIRANSNCLFFYGESRKSRLTIQQDGNVGIGTMSPTEKLTVQGNISAENYIYKTAKHGHMGVAGTVFIPFLDGGEVWIPSEDGYGYLIADDPVLPTGNYMNCDGNCQLLTTPVDGHVYLRANVVLPDKVKVTQFTCFWWDETIGARADFEFKLMRKQWNDVTATTMATVAGSTTNSRTANIVRTTTTMSVNEPIINTANSSYYIIGTWSVADMVRGGDDLRFYGCRIHYEITQIGPDN